MAVFDGVDRYRKQYILASSTIALVTALCTVTGFVALHRSASQQDQARRLDRQILLLERLRDSTREIGSSARRYMVSGDHKEEQRISAISDAMKFDRAELDARNNLGSGPLLEANLDEYLLGVSSATAQFEADPIERLSRFEEQITPPRQMLADSFDSMISHERKQRTSLRSANTLATVAQWTLLAGGVIGVMLALALCISVPRRLARAVVSQSAPSTSLPTEPLPERPALLL